MAVIRLLDSGKSNDMRLWPSSLKKTERRGIRVLKPGRDGSSVRRGPTRAIGLRSAVFSTPS